MSVLPAVTAELLPQSPMVTWTEGSFASKAYRGNGVSTSSYCSTVTHLCYGYINRCSAVSTG